MFSHVTAQSLAEAKFQATDRTFVSFLDIHIIVVVFEMFVAGPVAAQSLERLELLLAGLAEAKFQAADRTFVSFHIIVVVFEMFGALVAGPVLHSNSHPEGGVFSAAPPLAGRESNTRQLAMASASASAATSSLLLFRVIMLDLMISWMAVYLVWSFRRFSELN
nr:hypothetical protein Iba_chr08aCG11860 [Ipomoea batatas]